MIPCKLSSKFSQIRILCKLSVFTAFEKKDGYRRFVKIIYSSAGENAKEYMYWDYNDMSINYVNSNMALLRVRKIYKKVWAIELKLARHSTFKGIW